VDQVAMGHIFLQVFQFSFVEYHSTNTPHSFIHSMPEPDETDLLAAAVQRNLSWHTTTIIKKIYITHRELTSAKVRR